MGFCAAAATAGPPTSNGKVMTTARFLLAATPLALALPAVADLSVPGDYDTIQAAIDAAGEDETILVGPGTYLERIDLMGKAITLRSTDGPESTILDGTSDSDCCAVHGAGGCQDGGCQASVCVARPTCCSVTWDLACAVWAIYLCDECDGIGSVISCVTDEGPDTVIDGFTITGGTGTFVEGVGFEGGGLLAVDSSPTVVNCIFADNNADYGGAVFNLLADSTLINCAFTGNLAFTFGGGMYNGSSNPALINCTFSTNAALSLGGGMYNGSSNPTVDNCIFWSNSDSGGTDESAQIHVQSDSATVNYSCIQGGWSGAGGTGNIDEDPQFANELGPDGTAGTGDEDLRLDDGSPCIDAGDNTAVPVDVTTDLDGNARIRGVAVDMGPYEAEPRHGTADMVWYAPLTGQAYAWLMNGLDIIGEGAAGTLDPALWTIVGLGDINGDGRTDILWRKLSNGQIWAYIMDGTDRIDQGPVVTLSPDVWSFVGVGDFNHDDRDDLVWRKASSGKVVVQLLDGFTVIDEGTVGTLNPKLWAIVGLGDLDGDGKCDIVWRKVSNGQVWVYFMDGTQKAGQDKVGTLSPDLWAFVGLGDFNDDERDDIVWRKLTNGQTLIFLMDGADKIGQGKAGTLNPALWTIVGLGDLNADRRCDILWRKINSGQTWVYFMDGLDRIDQGSAGNPGSDWDLAGLGDLDGPS
jgi:hypothetical protein